MRGRGEQSQSSVSVFRRVLSRLRLGSVGRQEAGLVLARPFALDDATAAPRTCTVCTLRPLVVVSAPFRAPRVLAGGSARGMRGDPVLLIC